MQEAIRTRVGFVEGVIKCYPDETLDAVIERIVKAEVRVCYERVIASSATLALLVITQLLAGPSPGPGGQGRRGQGHHLSL